MLIQLARMKPTLPNCQDKKREDTMKTKENITNKRLYLHTQTHNRREKLHYELVITRDIINIKITTTKIIEETKSYKDGIPHAVRPLLCRIHAVHYFADLN